MFASTLDIEEVWRWQDGTVIADGPGDQAGVVDSEGNAIIVGGMYMVYRNDDWDQSDFGVYKIDGYSGREIWSWRDSSGDNTYDRTFAVDVDRNDNIIAGGQTTGSWISSANDSLNGDWAAFKLDGDTGEEIWRYQRWFTGQSTDGSSGFGLITCIATTSEGDAFLVGYYQVLNADLYSERHYAVIKVNGVTGEELWAVGGWPSDTHDMFNGCAVDSQDYLVAAGYTLGSVSSASNSADAYDIFVVKFDPNGDQIWQYENGGTELRDVAEGVAIDSDDHVYVAGNYEVVFSPVKAANYSTVIKLDGTNGEVKWRHEAVAPMEDKGAYEDLAVDITTGTVVAVGSTNGVWVSGGSSAGDRDFAATVLDASTGEELGRWQDGTAEYERAESAAFDSEGSLFIFGSTQGEWSESGSQGGEDFAVVKFGHPRASGSDLTAVVIGCVIAGLVIISLFVACKSQATIRNRMSPCQPLAASVQAQSYGLVQAVWHSHRGILTRKVWHNLRKHFFPLRFRFTRWSLI